MPKSESLTLIFRRSIAWIVSFLMGTSYCLPVRLSVIVKVSRFDPAGISVVTAGSDFGGFIPEPFYAMKPEVAAHIIYKPNVQRNARQAKHRRCRTRCGRAVHRSLSMKWGRY